VRNDSIVVGEEFRVECTWFEPTQCLGYYMRNLRLDYGVNKQEFEQKRKMIVS